MSAKILKMDKVRETQKEIVAVQEKIVEVQEEMIKATQSHVAVTQKITGLLEKVFDVLEQNANVWKSFLVSFKKIVKGIIFFVIVVSYREEIVIILVKLAKYFIYLWDALSENWQTALFQSIFGILAVIMGIILDRKLIRK